MLAAGLCTEVIRRVLPCTNVGAPQIQPCTEVVAVLLAELGRIDGLASKFADSRRLLASILDEAGYRCLPNHRTPRRPERRRRASRRGRSRAGCHPKRGDRGQHGDTRKHPP